MGHASLHVSTKNRTEFVDITASVKAAVRKDGLKSGICLVYVPHTTAGITINEAADPSVRRDIVEELNKIVPFEDRYKHLEGNSAAHIKASLMGSSVTIPVRAGELSLGTWQGIYVCEFDGPRNRTFFVTCVPGESEGRESGAATGA
jgi:secondary thiamine-phosphate synthase enzyme